MVEDVTVDESPQNGHDILDVSEDLVGVHRQWKIDNQKPVQIAFENLYQQCIQLKADCAADDPANWSERSDQETSHDHILVANDIEHLEFLLKAVQALCVRKLHAIQQWGVEVETMKEETRRLLQDAANLDAQGASLDCLAEKNERNELKLRPVMDVNGRISDIHDKAHALLENALQAERTARRAQEAAILEERLTRDDIRMTRQKGEAKMRSLENAITLLGNRIEERLGEALEKEEEACHQIQAVKQAMHASQDTSSGDVEVSFMGPSASSVSGPSDSPNHASSNSDQASWKYPSASQKADIPAAHAAGSGNLVPKRASARGTCIDWKSAANGVRDRSMQHLVRANSAGSAGLRGVGTASASPLPTKQKVSSKHSAGPLYGQSRVPGSPRDNLVARTRDESHENPGSTRSYPQPGSFGRSGRAGDILRRQ